ncbi:MAG: Glyoxalase-like domain [Mucilaginibacter sp.]|nr:Glyoxalase-like domain [Mucilaginibacter sp.]
MPLKSIHKRKNYKMAKIDPIIAVKDIEASSKWYQSVFNWRSLHGGKEFDILVSENDEILICLHQWGEDEHPTMTNPNITPGNGLILYFRTENMHIIRQNVEKLGYAIEEDIHLNPNSTKMEFSLRDPDGYYLTITEFHKYED